MTEQNSDYDKQKDFWERAGQVGYGEAIFADSKVERHIISKQWDGAMEAAAKLGLTADSSILELGCGDGAFANSVLSKKFKDVTAYDAAENAIKSASSSATRNTDEKAGGENTTFAVKDLIGMDYSDGDRWDGAFLIGFLHHVKSHTPAIVSRLSKVTGKVVVVEPNGNNLIRKALELQPSYKAAGEDSFKLKDLTAIFKENGYSLASMKRVIFIPSMLPGFLFTPFKLIEDVLESNGLLSRLCSTYVLGFEKSGK